MTRRAPVSLADLLEAHSALRGAEPEEIRVALGLEVRSRRAEPAKTRTVAEVLPEGSIPSVAAVEPAPERPEPLGRKARALRRTSGAAGSFGLVPRTKKLTLAGGAPSIHQPLFEPRGTRAILTEVMTTLDAAGAIDVERLIRILSRGRVVRSLPRRSVRSTRRGVQLLLDRSEGMFPFLRDCAELRARVEDVIQTVETRLFRGSPEAMLGDPYRVPPPRTPVVIVSDLGLFCAEGGAPVGAWREFASRVEAAGCPVVALVPMPRGRVPELLLRAMHVVEWDRHTTARSARRERRG